MSENATWSAIILAAGQGKRMKSDQPKVLHEIAGRPMISWVVMSALAAGATHCVVVVGAAREAVTRELSTRFGSRVQTVVQTTQRGTGDAVRCAIEGTSGLGERVVVLYGDCPLIPHDLVRTLVAKAEVADCDLGLVTAAQNDPTGYGRIIRDEHGAVIAVREDRDCTEAERQIREINPGLYAIRSEFLEEAVSQLADTNAQKERYLTDVVELASRRGRIVDLSGDIEDLRGVNDRVDLAVCHARARRLISAKLARSGVGIAELDSAFIDIECEVDPGAFIGPQVHLRGHCIVRAGAFIDAGCILTDVVVEPHAVLLPYCVASDSTIGAGAQIGPFSHLRPQTEVGSGAKVGNFTETKKTQIGEGSKVNHLSYVGDGVIGREVNIGAGTIFCNYDGEQKHTTVLEDEVFVGSDSQFVAPVTVGKGAYVASGSTITKDVPEDGLALSRTRQENKPGYAGRLRARLRAMKKKR